MAQENGSSVPDPVKENVPIEDGQTNNLEDKFYVASKKWRKQMNHLQCQIVNQENIPSLEKESRILEKCMKDISRETNQMLKQVGEIICELKSKDDEAFD